MARHTVSKTISDEQLNAIIQIESAGVVDVKAATSSATGLGQFLNATWMAEVAEHRSDLLEGRTKAEVLALRKDPAIMVEILARFTEDNARTIGSGFSDGDLYLAHFLGAGAARKFFRAAPETSAALLAGPDAVKANRSILGGGKTAGDVRAWATKKMAQKPKADWVTKYYRGSAVGPLTPEMHEADAETTDTGIKKTRVFLIQQRLETMGYFPGLLDGKWGGKTSGAIAGFLNDIPESAPIPAPTSEEEFWTTYEQIDALTLKYEPGFRRPIAEARATANASDLSSAGNKTTNSNWWTRVIAKVQAIGAAVAGFFWMVVAKLSDNEFIKPIIEMLGLIPGWVWAATGLTVLSLVAALVWRSTHASDDGVVENYRTGKLS